MSPIPIIIGLLYVMLIGVLVWAGVSLAWGLVIILTVTLIGAIVAFVVWADELMRW